MESVILKEKFNDGDTIIDEGYTSNYAYFIINGVVKISKKVKDKKVVIGTLEKGAVFGEMGIIHQSPRTASVTAVGEVEVGMINKESFLKMLGEMPDDLRNIVQALVGRLQITTNKLAGIGVQLENAKKSINALSLSTNEDDSP